MNRLGYYEIPAADGFCTMRETVLPRIRYALTYRWGPVTVPSGTVRANVVEDDWPARRLKVKLQIYAFDAVTTLTTVGDAIAIVFREDGRRAFELEMLSTGAISDSAFMRFMTAAPYRFRPSWTMVHIPNFKVYLDEIFLYDSKMLRRAPADTVKNGMAGAMSQILDRIKRDFEVAIGVATT